MQDIAYFCRLNILYISICFKQRFYQIYVKIMSYVLHCTMQPIAAFINENDFLFVSIISIYHYTLLYVISLETLTGSIQAILSDVSANGKLLVAHSPPSSFLFVNIHHRFVISATYSNACLLCTSLLQQIVIWRRLHKFV